MTMDQVLARLFERLDLLGINVRVWLLDRGFYSVKVIRALIERQRPFIMPAIKRAKRLLNRVDQRVRMSWLSGPVVRGRPIR
jgi:hypothetical protein